ncbi:cripto-like protein precursor [Saccoglossus kowalevskii]|uniref:Cripto-like protein n=1 Tax=Saccoglossus kowalevskii TaxID=10224 RepID=D1LWZ3_SACKO|nr:cripto-like protein precursor [Saccoglossus kowalevskii]ACY92499.1 cripto-like protein [Saccoglossus kowalevskii]
MNCHLANLLAAILLLVMVTNVSSVSLGEWTNTRSSANICHNGGIMILDSFCICPIGYGGQYCESKPCGAVAHDEKLTVQCNTCLCRDGKLYCVPLGFPACETTDEVIIVITSAPITTSTYAPTEAEDVIMFSYGEFEALSSVAAITPRFIQLVLPALVLLMTLWT